MQKKIKSPQDLKSLKEKAKAEIDMRTGQKEIRLVVHMGTCGIAAGARSVLEELVDEFGRASINNVTLLMSGCLGLCDQEPMFTLTDKSGQEFCYGDLNKKRVREIVKEHILGGNPVTEYIVRT
jgi:NADP-reducing hydrogenase subunit HndB